MLRIYDWLIIELVKGASKFCTRLGLLGPFLCHFFVLALVLSVQSYAHDQFFPKQKLSRPEPKAGTPVKCPSCREGHTTFETLGLRMRVLLPRRTAVLCCDAGFIFLFSCGYEPNDETGLLRMGFTRCLLKTSLF